jgi:hypothetical protein
MDLLDVGGGEKFMQQWGDNGFIHLEGNWAGNMWDARLKQKGACHRINDQIMVLQDGRVSLCCFDGDGDVILGDLNTQTIREVFMDRMASIYRMAHAEGRRGELKLCSTCTTI